MNTESKELFPLETYGQAMEKRFKTDEPPQQPVYRERWSGHIAEVYINEKTGGYRIFVDKKEHECGWYQLTHASEQARVIAQNESRV